MVAGPRKLATDLVNERDELGSICDGVHGPRGKA